MLCGALKQTIGLRGFVMMRVVVSGICVQRSIRCVGVLVTMRLVAWLRFRLAIMPFVLIVLVIVAGRITVDMIVVPILSKTFLMIMGRMAVLLGVGALA